MQRYIEFPFPPNVLKKNFQKIAFLFFIPHFKAVKKEFFEKIYINREVVQEASVWFYIKWMGKRNEPINSLSLLLRHRLKTKGTKEKVLFT